MAHISREEAYHMSAVIGIGFIILSAGQIVHIVNPPMGVDLGFGLVPAIILAIIGLILVSSSGGSVASRPSRRKVVRYTQHGWHYGSEHRGNRKV